MSNLVIDACVAGAAGSRLSIHPRGVACREFLRHVRDICHSFVLTEELRREWEKHETPFSRKWRVSMYHRGKCHHIKCLDQQNLLSRIRKLDVGLSDRRAMAKDAHLIAAALQCERIVVSIDATAKELFHEAASRIGPLKNVMWVDPTDDAERLHRWLKRGARFSRKFCLGAGA